MTKVENQTGTARPANTPKQRCLLCGERDIHNETNTKGIAQEQFMGTKIKLVSLRPTPDMVDRATLHAVIDKNGVAKADNSKHQISCK